MVRLTNNYTLLCRDLMTGNLTDYSEDLNSTTTECICLKDINTRGCAEESIVRTIDMAVVATTMVMFCVGVSFLYYRLYVQGQSLLFPASNERGIIRLRPQEAFHICASVYGILTAINKCLVLSDAYPSLTVALVGNTLPDTISYSLGSLYPIGIVYSSSTIARSSLSDGPQILNKHIIDAISFLLLIGPPVSIISMTVAWGYHLDNGDIDSARRVESIKHTTWDIWFVVFMVLLMSFWLKMHRALQKHISKLKRSSEPGSTSKIKRIKAVSRHLIIIVTIAMLLFMCLFVMSFFSSPLRNNVQETRSVTKVIFFIWNQFEIALLVGLGQIVIFFNVLHSHSRCCCCFYPQRDENEPKSADTTINIRSEGDVQLQQLETTKRSSTFFKRSSYFGGLRVSLGPPLHQNDERLFRLMKRGSSKYPTVEEVIRDEPLDPEELSPTLNNSSTSRGVSFVSATGASDSIYPSTSTTYTDDV